MGAAVAMWGLLIGVQALNDNSLLTHIATGRVILDRGSVPSTDPFSFTASGESWTVQSWLASVVYAGAERAAGLAGIHVVHAVLCTVVALLVWRLARPASDALGRILVVAPPLLIGTALILLTLLGGFAYLLVDSQSRVREESQKRFQARAVISAALTESLFTSARSQGQREAAKEFGAARP